MSISKKLKFAQKWDEKSQMYYPCQLPEGATVYETDMNRLINCADCGRPLTFGRGYTSREIHTNAGIGYCVCETCYFKDRK